MTVLTTFVFKKMGNVSSSLISIEDDHKDMALLLESAKFGKWEAVWGILEKKPYMINCCPENRRWTVLQQAVWWNKPFVVKRLLQFPTIDSYAKAKEGKSEIGDDGGLTAFEIAEKFKYTEVSELLHSFVCGIENHEIDTFHSYDDESALLRITLAAYKNTFHPSTIDSKKSMNDILKNIFESMNTTDTWKVIRDKLSESVFMSFYDHSQRIQKIKTCESREEFFDAVVYVYTQEESRLYDCVNTALRRQRSDGFKPTAADLALGPYIVVYQVLLMFWDKLDKEPKRTFRKMQLSKNDVNKYKKGIQFTWLSFVSSSVVRIRANPFPTSINKEGCNHPTLFIIDNHSCARQLQPRNIEEIALHRGEKERVYPAGSRFEVYEIREKTNETEVYLKLIS